MSYTYYPGCSLHTSSRTYDESMRAVFSKLGAELVELDDWNCCGATVYMSVKETVALAISARNLALAEESGRDLVAPCSACFTVLNKTRRFMEEMPELRERVGDALAAVDLHPDYSVRVRHPLDVLTNDIGLERLAAARERALDGVRVACYYGCQILRPERAVDADAEVPTSMDRMFELLGAQTVDFAAKTRCCGGMLMTTSTNIALDLVDEILGRAANAGANVIVTACPLCQINLELYQKRLRKRNGRRDPIPVLFFTQLIGLALGCSEKELGLQRQVIPFSAEHAGPVEVST